ncbi:MAG: hypothetical protein AB1480_09790 [Nitrospirota bacterium]
MSEYILIDCNRIQEYVFASTRLKGICNASLLLDDIETVKIPGLLSSIKNAKIIRSGGGIVLARFDVQSGADEAKRFLRQAADIYREYGLTITSHVLPSTTSTNFYDDILKPLLDIINEKKERPTGTSFNLSTILAIPCKASGKGAAREVLVESFGSVSRDIPVSHTEWKKYKSPRTLHQIEEELKGKFKRFEIPSDLGGIVSWTKRDIPWEKPPGTSEDRILGVIYADINGLGGLTNIIAQDEVKYSSFCKGLRDTLKDSLKEAIEYVLKDAIAKQYKGSIPPSNAALPFRILYIGGDDLAVAVKGCYAMDIAKGLLQKFKEKSRQFITNFEIDSLPEHLTLSAGLVLAPYDYPIRNFNLIGRGLENRAKHIGRQSGTTPPPSLVDICMVKNNSIGSYQDIRSLKEVEDRFLYADPYSPDEIENLKKASQNLITNGFPNTKLRKLPEIFSIPGDGAKYQFLNWWYGLRDNDKKTYEKVCGLLNLPKPPNMPFIQSRAQRKLVTPIVDIVELNGLYRLIF